MLRPVEVLGAVAVQHVEGGRHGLVLAQALKIEAAQTFIRNINKVMIKMTDLLFSGTK